MPFKYGTGNSKAMMNPAKTIEITCMTGALTMNMMKKASLDGALRMSAVR